MVSCSCWMPRCCRDTCARCPMLPWRSPPVSACSLVPLVPCGRFVTSRVRASSSCVPEERTPADTLEPPSVEVASERLQPSARRNGPRSPQHHLFRATHALAAVVLPCSRATASKRSSQNRLSQTDATRLEPARVDVDVGADVACSRGKRRWAAFPKHLPRAVASRSFAGRCQRGRPRRLGRTHERLRHATCPRLR